MLRHCSRRLLAVAALLLGAACAEPVMGVVVDVASGVVGRLAPDAARSQQYFDNGISWAQGVR